MPLEVREIKRAVIAFSQGLGSWDPTLDASAQVWTVHTERKKTFLTLFLTMTVTQHWRKKDKEICHGTDLDPDWHISATGGPIYT
mgnify:CR=1 FL=1|jgi:hypothetical protein